MEGLELQSPPVNTALVYPELALIRSVDGEVRPRPNDFSASGQAACRVRNAKTQFRVFTAV
jgi:hypothetical protein